jgi:putative FmdB family regulatory protein
MPNYDYVCAHCGHKEEILQKMTDDHLIDCPQCKQPTFKRKFGAGIGLQFHGSGFYSTDYGNKSVSSEKEKPTPTPEKEKSSSSSTPGCGCGKSSCSA